MDTCTSTQDCMTNVGKLCCSRSSFSYFTSLREFILLHAAFFSSGPYVTHAKHRTQIGAPNIDDIFTACPKLPGVRRNTVHHYADDFLSLVQHCTSMQSVDMYTVQRMYCAENALSTAHHGRLCIIVLLRLAGCIYAAHTLMCWVRRNKQMQPWHFFALSNAKSFSVLCSSDGIRCMDSSW